MQKNINIISIVDDKSKNIPYDSLDQNSFKPAVLKLIDDLKKKVDEICSSQEKPTFENVEENLSNTTENLNYVWSVISHLNSVNDSPELRDIVNSLIQPLSEVYSLIGQNEALYAKYKAIKADKCQFDQLSKARKRIIDKDVEDFVLSGAELNETDKARMRAISAEASALCQKFSENLLDCTNDFALYLPKDTEELTGVPEETKALLAQQAQNEGKEGYKITLQMPNYFPLMQYAENRDLRKKLHHAFATRASEFSPAGKDNAPIIEKLLKLRVEKAHLLGFENFAELSIKRKMAESSAQVVNFLRELARKAKPAAQKEYEELVKFGHESLKIDKVYSWDTAFISEKLRQAKYDYSGQQLKKYFTLPTVLSGLFKLVETLFSISIEEKTVPVWHPDVKYFVVKNSSGKEIASFYADLYARKGKRGGAWMGDQRSRRLVDGKIQTPVAYLVCNFAAPVGNKPSLLSLSDVSTIFHEFGHGLHHMLTQQVDLAVSGISGVEWDAVEMPSQFMENFVLNWEVMQTITSHVDTGEKLPRELFDKVVAAKYFQAGLSTVRQIEFALFDMLLHTDEHPEKEKVGKLLDEVRNEVAVSLPPEYDRFADSFSHIFAGGYAAGYYSYKWAEVLSADAFSLFEEKGLFNKEIGKKWLDEILSQGGSRPALESFVAFRGRKPQVEPLLRQYGLIK